MMTKPKKLSHDDADISDAIWVAKVLASADVDFKWKTEGGRIAFNTIGGEEEASRAIEALRAAGFPPRDWVN